MTITRLADHPHGIAELSELCGREWSHLYPGWDTSAARQEFERPPGPDGLPVTLVAVDGDILLGTVSVIRDDLPGWEHCNPWLASLFVLPGRRGSGVASALVRAAEDLLRGRGVTEAWLFTESARGLFEKLGWRFFAAARCHGNPVDVLRKNLAPPPAGS